MLPSRFVPASSSVNRKSRLEPNRPSFLPKPSRRAGSTERASMEARRPSGAGHRSSSAEPPRATIGARLSRETSASKIPFNRRSKSQQGDSRYGQSAVTPLRSSHYSRPTTTPQRTPSQERTIARSWQTCLDRALAFVTVKDTRPVSNVAWQRAEYTRVAGRLEARGRAGALVRPLTIARFVELVGDLFAGVTRDARLNNDNYVTRLPHMCKRVLYPGVVSKSWLKAVNTLHAFPHALALIAYLLDIVLLLEKPVEDELLYLDKDELAALRREYLFKCWIRFQEPGHQFQDLNEEYLLKLKALLGNHEEKIAELQHCIKKYETCLEAESDPAGKAEEVQRVERRDSLLNELRRLKAERLKFRSQRAALGDGARDNDIELKHTVIDITTAEQEIEAAAREVAQQSMCVAERARLLDQVDYSNKVLDSKRALAEQIDKMVVGKEAELARWQELCLAGCGRYSRRLIRLATQLPQLAPLPVDEKELMTAACADKLAAGLAVLKAAAAELSARRAASLRDKHAISRKRAMAIEEAFTSISRTKLAIQEEQQALEAELQKEAGEARALELLERALAERLRAAELVQEDAGRALHELSRWEASDSQWRAKLSELEDYVTEQQSKMAARLDGACARRGDLVASHVQLWLAKLHETER